LVKAAAGATLISVVHNPALLPVLAHRVIGIQHGAILFDCAVTEVTDALLASLYRADAHKMVRPMATPASGQFVTPIGAAR